MVSITDFVNKYLGGVADAVASVLDTIVFIEFIYEEALQTALFAAKTAIDNKDYTTAQAIIDFILIDIYPSARTFIDTWGDIAPYSKNCFSLFYEAAKQSAEILNNAIPTTGREEGTLRIYTNIDQVEIYIDGEFVGYADNTEGLLVQVPAGSHSIEAKKEGYETAVRQVRIEPKEYKAIKINLVEE